MEQHVCPNCHAPVSAGNAFCQMCGTPIPKSAPAQSHTFCRHCGAVLQSGDTFCCNCGNVSGVQPVTPPPAAAKPEKEKKTFNFLPLIISIAAVVVLILAVVITGTLTDWFGLYGPGTKIALAAANTVKSGNLTAEFRMETSYDYDYYSGSSEIEGTLQADVNLIDQTIMVYGVFESEGEDVELAIYDEQMIMGYDGEYYTQDIDEYLDDIFESIENGQDSDWDEILDKLDELTGGELSENIDTDMIGECLSNYLKCWNKTSWLKENAGYSTYKEGGVRYHRFQPKMYTLLSSSMAYFEPIFEDGDIYDEAMDSLKDSKRDLNDVDYDIALGIRSGKLHSVNFSGENDYTEIEMEILFTDIGKTEIDVDMLEDMLDEVE